MALVGAGLEFPTGGFSVHDIDVSDTQILFDYDGSLGSGVFSNLSFNGFRLYDAGGSLHDILSVSFSSGVGYTGGNIPALSFDANNIFVNFAGISFASGHELTLDVRISAVPEPGSLALVGLGLLSVGYIRTRAARTRERKRT